MNPKHKKPEKITPRPIRIRLKPLIMRKTLREKKN